MEKYNYKLSPEERETIILYSDASKECTVYTCSKPLITKLNKLCLNNPTFWNKQSSDSASCTYKTIKSLISFRSFKKGKLNNNTIAVEDPKP